MEEQLNLQDKEELLQHLVREQVVIVRIKVSNSSSFPAIVQVAVFNKVQVLVQLQVNFSFMSAILILMSMIRCSWLHSLNDIQLYCRLRLLLILSLAILKAMDLLNLGQLKMRLEQSLK